MQTPLQFDTVGAAHLDVDQCNIECLLGDTRERFIRALGGGDIVTFLYKPFGQRITYAELIINN